MIKIFRWTTRIISGLIVLFFLLFVVGYAIAPVAKSSSNGLTTNEIFMFIAVGIMLTGLVLAWKWEAAGGMTTIIGYLAFTILEGHLFTAYPFDICLILAILYLISWWLHRRRRAATAE